MQAYGGTSFGYRGAGGVLQADGKGATVGKPGKDLQIGAKIDHAVNGGFQLSGCRDGHAFGADRQRMAAGCCTGRGAGQRVATRQGHAGAAIGQ